MINQENISWPVFVKGVDGGLYYLNSMKDAGFNFEEIDFEENEFVDAWDSEGHPCTIYWDEKHGAKIKMESLSSEIEQARKAIIEYANIMVKHHEFNSGTESLKSLYLEAEEFIKKHKYPRIKKLLNKIRGHHENS